MTETGSKTFIETRLEALDWAYDGDTGNVVVIQFRETYRWLWAPPVIAESLCCVSINGDDVAATRADLQLGEADGTHKPHYHKPYEASCCDNYAQHRGIATLIARRECANHAQKWCLRAKDGGMFGRISSRGGCGV